MTTSEIGDAGRPPGAAFWAGFQARSARVYADHPELVDHRSDFPWLTGALGDPFASVWFVAENPSLTQVRRVAREVCTVETQWTGSRGDKLLRDALAKHGFKMGGPLSPGGWRCYITDVIKSADIVKEWRYRPEADRRRVLRAWAPVLAYELEQGKPDLIMVLGKNADTALHDLAAERLIPDLPLTRRILHYSYLAMRPETSGLRRRQEDPGRIAEWHRDFAWAAERAFGSPPPCDIDTS